MNINQIKNFLKQEIAQDNLSFVFELLSQYTKSVEDSLLDEANEIIQLFGRHNDLKKKTRQGTIDKDSEKVEKNQIRTALVELIDLYEFTNASIITQNPTFKRYYLSQLDEASLFQEIEKRFDLLFEKIQSFLDVLKEREPAYEWTKEFAIQIQVVRKKWGSRRFQIAVIALIKSGKSTLLNSWIGNEYLPSASVAETMRVVRVRHNPNNIVGVLYKDGEEVARGVGDVKQYIRKLNEDSRNINRKNVTETEVRLEVDVAALNNRELSKHNFDILDTPGANEAGITPLQAKVERVAKTSDVIIYVMDYTKLKTQAEEQIFKDLKESRKELFTQVRSRLFFVVNKMDEANRHDRERNMDQRETKKYVQKIIMDTIALDMNLDDIILISAEHGLLSRRIESGEASDEQIIDFKEIAFGKIGARKKSLQDCQEVAPEVLGDSGYKELEDKILKVIYQKRSQIFFSSVIDDLQRHFNQAENDLQVGKATLNTDVKEIEKLQKKIKEFQREILALFTDAEKFKKKAVSFVEKELKYLQSELNQEIFNAFSGARDSVASTPWLQELTDLFRQTDYILKSHNRQDVEAQLNNIHYRVVNNIGELFDQSWNHILDGLYEEYCSLSKEIESKANPIIRKIEEVINESLKVDLNPVPILQEISLDEFYYATQLRLDELVKAKNQSNMNFLESIWNMILNIFGSGRQEIKYREHSISSKAYAEFMKGAAQDLIDEAKELVEQRVGDYYLASIEKMKEELNDYSQRYINITQKEIEQKQKGVTNIPDRIALMEEDINKVKSLEEMLSQNRDYLKF